MMEWIENHIDSPYLNQESINLLKHQTGLDPQQIKNFVSNYRKRHWPNRGKKSLRSLSEGYTRNGQWTVPEIKYVAGILEAYYAGSLNDIVEGRSIREVIASCLLCKAMRVSKKFPRRTHSGNIGNPIAQSKESHVAKIQQLRTEFVESLDVEVQWAYLIDPLQPISAEVEQDIWDVDLDWDCSGVNLGEFSMNIAA